MIQLTNVTFRNLLGGTATIFYKVQGQFAADTQTLVNSQPGPPINGTLLTIHLERVDEIYSCDFTNVSERALWVDLESPYVLDVIANRDRQLRLRVRDNINENVGVFPLAVV